MDVWKSIRYQMHFIPQATIVTMLLFMSYLFLTDNRGHVKERLKSFFKQRWIVTFLAYTAFLFTSTVIARYVSQPIFSGLGTFGIIRDGIWNKEIIFNIILFIPYTYLYIKAFDPEHKVRTTFLLSLCSTVFIELFQVLFWVGQGTVADLVHNILGGMIGYGLWYLLELCKSNSQPNLQRDGDGRKNR